MQEALAELGSTKESVIAKLRELGIKGRKWSDIYCPIAVFLEKHGVSRPIVSCRIVWGIEGHSIETPEHIHLAIKAINDGEYPDLLEEEP